MIYPMCAQPGWRRVDPKQVLDMNIKNVMDCSRQVIKTSFYHAKLLSQTLTTHDRETSS